MRRLIVVALGALLLCESVACPRRARADEPSAGTPPTASPETAPPPADASKKPATPAASPPAQKRLDTRPSALQVDYAQYGLAIGGDFDLASGPICPDGATTPCILGSGGGFALRGGYRPAGPWYFGAAYQFSKLDANNQFRLGTFQQLRGEMRYFLDLGSRIVPYFEWGAGGCIYGNLFGASTGGAVARAGAGFEFEITRFVVVGLDLAYQPALLVGYTDTTGQKRDTGVTQFLHFEVVIELKTELGRE
jgi:hypothetical protein